MQVPVHNQTHESKPDLSGGWVDIISTVVLNTVIGILLICLHAVLESR